MHQGTDWKRNFITGLILVLPILAHKLRVDNDIWFILNHGRYVLDNGIPYLEPFTIHEGMHFVMQQWLAAVIYWTAYDKLGFLGVNLVVIAVYLSVVLITYKTCNMLSSGNFIVTISVSTLVSVFLSVFMNERPYIFFIMIITLEVFILESFIATNNWKFLLFLPLLSILQVNLQAAMWPVLFIILFPYLIDGLSFKVWKIQGHGYGIKSLALVSAFMILAGFLNPYGLDAMTYLFRSYGDSEILRLVLEMVPPNVSDMSGAFIFASIFILICTFMFHKGETTLRHVLLVLGTSYMALASIRNFFIFVVCSYIPLSFYFRNFIFKETEERNPNLKIMLAAALSVIVIVLNYSYYINPGEPKTHDDIISNERRQAVEYLVKNYDIEGMALYTGYNDGNYAEFRGIKVYMDARAEVFLKNNNKKQDIFSEYVSLQAGRKHYREILNKYRFTHILAGENDILYVYLEKDPDYKKVYQSGHYKIFEKV